MNSSLIFRLNFSNSLFIGDTNCYRFFNRLLGFFKDFKLSTNNAILSSYKVLNFSCLEELILYLFEKPVLIVDIELIVKA